MFHNSGGYGPGDNPTNANTREKSPKINEPPLVGQNMGNLSGITQQQLRSINERYDVPVHGIHNYDLSSYNPNLSTFSGYQNRRLSDHFDPNSTRYSDLNWQSSLATHMHSVPFQNMAHFLPPYEAARLSTDHRSHNLPNSHITETFMYNKNKDIFNHYNQSFEPQKQSYKMDSVKQKNLENTVKLLGNLISNSSGHNQSLTNTNINENPIKYKNSEYNDNQTLRHLLGHNKIQNSHLKQSLENEKRQKMEGFDMKLQHIIESSQYVHEKQPHKTEEIIQKEKYRKDPPQKINNLSYKHDEIPNNDNYQPNKDNCPYNKDNSQSEDDVSPYKDNYQPNRDNFPSTVINYSHNNSTEQRNYSHNKDTSYRDYNYPHIKDNSPKKDNVSSPKDSYLPNRESYQQNLSNHPPYNNPIKDCPSYKDNYPFNKDNYSPNHDNNLPSSDNVSLNRDNYQQDKFNYLAHKGPPSQDNKPPSNYNIPPNKDNYVPSTDNYLPKKDNCLPIKDNPPLNQDKYEHKQNNNDPPRNYNFRSNRDYYQPSQANKDKNSPNNYNPPLNQDIYESNKNNYYPPSKDNVSPKRDNYQPDQDNYPLTKDNSQKKDNYQPKQDNYPTSKDNITPNKVNIPDKDNQTNSDNNSSHKIYKEFICEENSYQEKDEKQQLKVENSPCDIQNTKINNSQTVIEQSVASNKNMENKNDDLSKNSNDRSYDSTGDENDMNENDEIFPAETKIEIGEHKIELNVSTDEKDLTIYDGEDFAAVFIRDPNKLSKKEAKKGRIVTFENSIEEAMEAISNGLSSAYYECQYCNYYFNHPKRFLIHVKWHTFGMANVKRKEMARQQELEKQQYKTAKTQQCDVCEKQFKTLNSLTNHKQKFHSTDVECSICHTKVAGVLELRAHSKASHPQPWVCHSCGRHCSNKYTLAKHMRVHLEKHLSCQHCDKLFATETQLKDHQRVHERIARGAIYKCSYCDKSFYQTYNLQAHEKTHSQERPFSCDICNTKFSTNSTLKRHVRVSHNTDKPYACIQCSRCFAEPRTLVGHMSKAHPGSGVLGVKAANKLNVRSRKRKCKKNEDIFDADMTAELGLS